MQLENNLQKKKEKLTRRTQPKPVDLKRQLDSEVRDVIGRRQKGT